MTCRGGFDLGAVGLRSDALIADPDSMVQVQDVDRVVALHGSAGADFPGRGLVRTGSAHDRDPRARRAQPETNHALGDDLAPAELVDRGALKGCLEHLRRASDVDTVR